MSNESITLESSLKSIETENWLDRKFYRPIGFRIAMKLRNSGITPNQITIISIFVGVAGGACFYSTSVAWNILGVILMIYANILDCVDGQLARLTGIKSKVGRIIDGFAGDLWFATLYIAIALRLMSLGWGVWVFLFAILAGYSHSRQAAMADYYKTLHLFFISKAKGAEFDSYENLQRHWRETKWSDDRVYKFFLFFYRFYTVAQEKSTPSLQKFLKELDSKFQGEIPEKLRAKFRKKSVKLMPFIDMLTFNGRTWFLFIVTILGSLFQNPIWAGLPFLYYIYEIVILNVFLIYSVRKHEGICEHYREKINKY
ncbi:MAG: CDP-alcohol phosphatidyltransferase family protein [Bacteroidales bacterium]